MKRADLKNLLRDYGYIDGEIKRKEIEIKRIRDSSRAPAFDISGVVSHSTPSDAVSAAVIRIEFLESQIAELRKKKDKVDALLSSLSLFEKRVVEEKWIERTPWKCMPERFSYKYSRGTLEAIGQQALSKLAGFDA